MFELVIFYIICNMATSYVNEMSKHEAPCCYCVKLEQCYRHYSGTAVCLKKVNFILSANFNNENKLKVNLKFTLAKRTFK